MQTRRRSLAIGVLLYAVGHSVTERIFRLVTATAGRGMWRVSMLVLQAHATVK